MICERCGTYMPDDAITCDKCGTLLSRQKTPETGVQALRQGKTGASAVVMPSDKQKELPIYDDFGQLPQTRRPPQVERSKSKRAQQRAARFEHDAGRPTMKRGVPSVGGAGSRQVRSKPAKVYQVQKHMINWTHMILYMALFVILALAGGYFYLSHTDGGQRVMARMGKEAASQAYWQVGEEYLNTGAVDKAIQSFEAARAMDGEENINIDGLLMLGSAYEAAGAPELAEALYVELYTNIVPSRPEAYRNVIRMMLADGREPEAAEMMNLAYEKTGQMSFRQQRDGLLPKTPKTDLAAGRYSQDKVLTLSTTQSYDIYYTFDDEAKMPEEGVLYTGPVTLTEGTYNLRAVCVNGNLTSDPLEVSYRVVMPSPDAPNSNMAPKTYKTQRKNVRMRAMGEDKDVTIYYTVDGSDPDSDSPVWTGEPITMANGRATLKGIAVNKYGKESNIYECSIKTDAKPYPKTMYAQEDTFGDFEIMVTSREKFEEKFGAPLKEEEVKLQSFDDPCRQLFYDWGYAVMAKTSSGWKVCKVHMTDNITAGPRKTKIGDTMAGVVDQFRDMLQVESPSGNRGLYGDVNGNRGKIYLQEDGGYKVEYICVASDGRQIVLDYWIDEGKVTAITVEYI